MKKLLLLSMVAALACGAFAQGVIQSGWTTTGNNYSALNALNAPGLAATNTYTGSNFFLSGKLFVGGVAVIGGGGATVAAGTNINVGVSGSTYTVSVNDNVSLKGVLTVRPIGSGDGLDLIDPSGFGGSVILATGVAGVDLFVVDPTGNVYGNGGLSLNAALDIQWLAQTHMMSSATGKINATKVGGTDTTNFVSLVLGAEDSSHLGLWATNLTPPTLEVKTGDGANWASLTASNLTVKGSTTINGATMSWPSANATGALTNDGSGHLAWGVIAGGGGGSGTVTSVGMTGDGTVFNSSVGGSPITGSGTLTPTLVNAAANTALRGPTSGSAAAPTYRQDVTADLPSYIPGMWQMPFGVTYQKNRQMLIVQATSAGTGFTTLTGPPNVTPTGAGTMSAQASSSTLMQGMKCLQASGGAMGYGDSTGWVYSGRDFSFSIAMAPHQFTAGRFWFIYDGTGSANTTDTPNDTVGFRYSSIAGDTHWVCYSRNTTTTTATDSGVAVTLDSVYVLSVVKTGNSPATVKFYINGTLVATSSWSNTLQSQGFSFRLNETDSNPGSFFFYMTEIEAAWP